MLQCQVNDEDARVTWYREDQVSVSAFLQNNYFPPRSRKWMCLLQIVDINDVKYKQVSDGRLRKLEVLNVTAKDEGLFKCVVQGKETSAKLYVARKFICTCTCDRTFSKCDFITVCS